MSNPKSCNSVGNLYDISTFCDLKSIKEKINSMKKDLDRLLNAAEELDNKNNIYNNAIKIRKQMQKVKQKAQDIRGCCLTLKKMDEQDNTLWCPDPDYAFRIDCNKLESQDSCSDNSMCALCSQG